MDVNSLWNYFSNPPQFPSLSENIISDVAIIGGGITGISIAQSLSNIGLNVIVLEARTVGGGTTAHSTGNLYNTTDKILEKLRKKHDLKTIRILTQARSEAINMIEKNVEKFEIDCDFKRTPWYLFTMKEDADKKIIQEYDTAKEAGLNVEYADLNYPFSALRAIRMPNQAQLNSKRYVQGLAGKISSPTCRIFENSSVQSIDSKNDSHKLVTKNGNTISAKILIHATHTPKGIKKIQTFLGPYREYGIACKIRNENIDGIFWGYHGEENFISTRMYQRDNQSYLICVGYPHKVGQESDNEKSTEKLHKFAKKHFVVEGVSFKWGGQHYRPADFLPYIGKEDHDSTIFLATGFSTDGLVYGQLSGTIISDLIQDKKNQISELLRPYRKDYVSSAPNFMKENINVVKQYLKDIPSETEFDEFKDMAKETGKVVERDGQKLAVYKNSKDELNICSAVCTHMKCIVGWNFLEKSWDCPCHGTRYEATGELIEGPALHDLHKVNEEK